MVSQSAYKRVRRYFRRFGIDVGRWPSEQLGLYRTRVVTSNHVDLVLDVGANDGGYGVELRDFGYQGRIISFEPLEAARRRLESRRDPHWTVLPYAVGERSGAMDLNVAGNGGASSSLLPMLARHYDVAPDSRFVGKQHVEVQRLDQVWDRLDLHANNPFLKIDVQGYEGQVLTGAGRLLDQMIGVRIELTFAPLYDGGSLWQETIAFLEEYGYFLARIDPGFTDTDTGTMLQCDGTFLHPSRASTAQPPITS